MTTPPMTRPPLTTPPMTRNVQAQQHAVGLRGAAA